MTIIHQRLDSGRILALSVRLYTATHTPFLKIDYKMFVVTVAMCPKYLCAKYYETTSFFYGDIMLLVWLILLI